MTERIYSPDEMDAANALIMLSQGRTGVPNNSTSPDVLEAAKTLMVLRNSNSEHADSAIEVSSRSASPDTAEYICLEEYNDEKGYGMYIPRKSANGNGTPSPTETADKKAKNSVKGDNAFSKNRNN